MGGGWHNEESFSDYTVLYASMHTSQVSFPQAFNYYVLRQVANVINIYTSLIQANMWLTHTAAAEI